MAGEDIEVAVELLDIDAHVRDSLRSIDQYARAIAMRHLYHGLRGRDGSQGIRDVGEGNEFGAGVQQLFVFVEENLAIVIDWNDAQPGTRFGAKHLPGNDVGVMLDPALTF
jgi:hypothetical protein